MNSDSRSQLAGTSIGVSTLTVCSTKCPPATLADACSQSLNDSFPQSLPAATCRDRPLGRIQRESVQADDQTLVGRQHLGLYGHLTQPLPAASESREAVAHPTGTLNSCFGCRLLRKSIRYEYVHAARGAMMAIDKEQLEALQKRLTGC